MLYTLDQIDKKYSADCLSRPEIHLVDQQADQNFQAAVYLDKQRLVMYADENEQEHILGLQSGEMMLLWQLHRPEMGEAVEITTGTRNYP